MAGYTPFRIAVSGIAQNFARFKSNLEITSLQTETTSNRQKDIRAAVEAKMSVLDSFLTGSYVRDTMIAPLASADIDIFTVLHSKHFVQNGQSKLLTEIKAALVLEYPRTPRISPNGQAVTITFTDFKVDVVPAFNRKGGGFLIPDSKKGKWISTDPKKHIEYKTSQNAWHKGNLVPLIKMIKCWNRNNGSLFSSFYLELLIIKILNGITISDFPSGTRFFFDKARELIKYTVTDPAGLGGYVGGFNAGTTVEKAVTLMQKSYNKAVEAERLASAGQNIEAAKKWQEIFGDFFPVYV